MGSADGRLLLTRANELLTLADDPRRFDELMTALERAELSDDGWRHLAERVAAWPDTVQRKAPTPWLDDPFHVPFRTHRRWSLCNTLQLSGPLNPIVVEGLAECEWLGAIRTLSVSSSVIGDGLANLLAAPAFFEVTSLWIYNNRVSTSVATAIATSFPKLRDLLLGWSTLGDEGAAILTEARWTTTLERLTLFTGGIGSRGAELLAAARWPQLHRLALDRNPLSHGAAAIARAKHMPVLRELSLCECGIDDESAKALAESELIQRLASLNLTGNAITEATRQAFPDAIQVYFDEG